MSTRESPGRSRRGLRSRLARDAAAPRRDGVLTLALWLSIVASVAPLLSVVAAGTWLLGVTTGAAVLLGIGYGIRRAGLASGVATAVQAGLWLLGTTLFFFTDDALLWVIPTGDVVHEATLQVQQASNEILVGVAPLEPTSAVTFVLVAAMGLLTIALDHVVVTARMPLLGAVALIAVWLIPAIAVPSAVNAIGFALLAAALLFLIRAETRTREAPAVERRSAGVAAVAATIGVVAIVAALVGGSALPPPTVTAGAGLPASIDPTLELGDDLRQRSDVPVLSVRSDAPTLPYLRVTTLSGFDGAVWQPDRLRSVPLEEGGFGPVEVAEGVRVTEYRTNVTVEQLNSVYLPVSFPAVSVTGLDGQWRAVPFSRTVRTGQSNTQGQEYEIVTHVPRPTLEQIQAADARLAESRVGVYALPAGTPLSIVRTAQEVTAGAVTDYDKLVALQDWFRGPEFSYSLNAPVAEGFDGTGSDAVADFLEVKSGYCVHFAGAFALMARALDMPSRIAIGFLPGSYTGERVDDERVGEVTTSQLHAWPEVYFTGIGWVPFEPTKSLGVATDFPAETEPVPDDGGTDVADGPTPSTAPTSASPAPSTAPDRPIDDEAGPLGESAATVDFGPYFVALGTVLLVAMLPLLAGAVRRRWLRARGDAPSAWRYLQDAAIDLGMHVPASESPRAFGARLVAEGSADAAAMRRLVAVIERASYAAATGAAGASGASADGPDAFADAVAVRAAMLAAADGGVRARALLLPRSLVVRPGSAFAAG
ncbi:transglutaminaseTgpA domain-containing protein [Microbacterium telephonicum]|uniref:Transglutaminase superfamily protein n=1 Tax=Microbacterium telephonicum TaxID=1714841 RepID=A0A498BVM4_9MICO|nr:DUF3488 and transglutaminase-like domain-containing protein [Microbacterium telephonicum]RLK47492.1 transglutaminase superfamily protein [Microbacterium telephonicum]